MADNLINQGAQTIEKVGRQAGETIQQVGKQAGDVLFNKVGLSQLGDINNIPGMVAKLFLVLYIAVIAPRLSHKLMPIVDNTLFKILFFAVLLYLGNTDPVLAILIATVFVLTITFGRRMQQKQGFQETETNMMDKIKNMLGM